MNARCGRLWTLPRLVVALGLFVVVAAVGAAEDFEVHFTGRTLRFDYHHSGTHGEEQIGLDQLRLEGKWPGRRRHMLDDTNLGKYLFEVIDPSTNRVLYSQGFASIYGEWETTGEARAGVWRTFHESQRFPETRGRCQLVLSKRAADGTFRELHSTLVDPASRFVNRAPLRRDGALVPLFEEGAAAETVDLLILGDGYTEAELETFVEHAERLTETLFSTPPFDRHRSHFNVRALHVAASESGVTDPRADSWRESPLGLSYNAFDSERYVLTYRNRELREIAAQADYDALVLLANSRKYGGGGIFNLWTTAAARSGEAEYLVVHEFGHSFAGLGDEYYTSQVSYEEFTPAGVEPWEPNLTALLDADQLKWARLVEDGTPIPTPWKQPAYDEVSLAYQEKRQSLRAAGAEEEEVEALFAEIAEITTGLLSKEEHFGKVGAFAGAGYQAQGLYRPAVDCIMFTRNPSTFCPVCAEAIERVIRLHIGQ